MTKFLRLLIKIYKFIKSKKKFYKPKKTKYLFFDTETFQFNKHILKKENYETIDIRYESFYFHILKNSILLFIKQKDLTLLQIYIVELINYCEPDFIITFTNYDNFFWKMKKYIKKDIKTVIIQNAQVNGEDFKKMTEDLMGKSIKGKSEIEIAKKIKKGKFKKEKVDYLITFGKSPSKKYAQLIKTKNIISGSIRNNLFKNIKKTDNKYIVFISTYKHRLFDRGTFTKKNGESISFPVAKKTQDLIILKILLKFSKMNNLGIKIISRGFKKEDLQREKSYFTSLIGNNFELLEKKKTYDSYKTIRKYRNFVYVTSTLGVEALSLGRRAAVINAYHKLFDLSGGENMRYGWPQQISSKGPFWTNDFSEKEIFRVLNFMYKSKDYHWNKIKKKYVDPSMIYDYKNIKLKKTLTKIGLDIL